MIYPVHAEDGLHISLSVSSSWNIVLGVSVFPSIYKMRFVVTDKTSKAGF